jgi:hypothetical protein
MSRACRWMAHLRTGAGAGIHGKVGQGIGHLVVRAHLVDPVAHAELIREASRVQVEAEEPNVLGRSMVPHLPEDERTVADHFEVWPAVRRRRAETSPQAVVLRLVVGGGAVRLAQSSTPHQRRCSIRASDLNDAGARSPRSGVATRTSIEEERRGCRGG